MGPHSVGWGDMRSAKMTDGGKTKAHLPVGCAGDGSLAASRDDGRSYTERGGIERAGRNDLAGPIRDKPRILPTD